VRLKQQLDAEGSRLPIRIDGAGRSNGGGLLSRGHTYKIVSNPIYVGRVAHKGQVHEGQHPPVVPEELWDQVQHALRAHLGAVRSKRTHQASKAMLAGKLFDDRGNRMSPSWVKKGSKRWRYCVSQAALQGDKSKAGSVVRISAAAVEAPVAEQGPTSLSGFALMRPGRGRFSLAPRRQLTEALPGLHEDRGLAACPLVAADNHVDMKRIKFDPATGPASGLCGDEGRAGAEEWVDDQIVAIGEVEERVLEHGARLDGRMVLEAASGVGPERRGARIGPDVRAPATTFVEFDVVDVRHSPFLEQRQEFMLGAVETAHADVGLRPDDEIQGDQAEFRSSGMSGRKASPIDETAPDAAVTKVG
jgi:Recombinase